MMAGEITALEIASGRPVRVRWGDGVITHYEPASAVETSDWWIGPGLFDVQVNGFGGIDFQGDLHDVEALHQAARALRAAGCLRILLTLVTDRWDRLIARLKRLRRLRASSPDLRRLIAGWHLEGPFLSAVPGFHGAHDPALMIDPTRAHINELRQSTGDDPVLLTVAPERAGALEAIAEAVSLGMRVSLGHTDAPADILKKAMAAGASGFTHLGNACPQQLDRHDNILWRLFETRGLKVSLIPDGLHVSPALFRLVHRVFPSDTILYTTDSMAAAGAPPGRYRLGALELEVGADGVVRQPGRQNFAGSALTPVGGVFRASAMLDVPWTEVWTRWAGVPREWLGLPAQLAAGQPAEFCLLRVSESRALQELRAVTVFGETTRT